MQGAEMRGGRKFGGIQENIAYQVPTLCLLLQGYVFIAAICDAHVNPSLPRLQGQRKHGVSKSGIASSIKDTAGNTHTSSWMRSRAEVE